MKKKGNVLLTANKQEMESFIMEWQKDLIAFETKNEVRRMFNICLSLNNKIV